MQHRTREQATRTGIADRFTLNLVLLLFLSVLTACGGTDCPDPPAPVELGTLPYHPLALHLDLSILAYQLHGQSLVWPFDPYYEERAEPLGSTRNDFMANVRTHATGLPTSPQLDSIRGPGIGRDHNPAHDPILYNYSRIHPWSSCVMNAAGRWTEYLTPRPITARIGSVEVAFRFRPPSGPEQVLLEPVPARSLPGDRDADASDVLLAFEGGTGDKGETGMPASQSLMGFVLVRDTGADTYDIHISFRGSRSGKAARAFFLALSSDNAAGNPDWITDLGTRAALDPVRSSITTIGHVARGFATSVQAMLPQIAACLRRASDLKSGVAPTNIYVTGHSLGGALAQHFASAVLLGSALGPDGAGPDMPAQVLGWPWQNLKLITYGAPRAGDETWARALTTTKLDSVFYARGFLPFDDDALESTAPDIAPRLIDPARPVGYRVLISTDPITSAIPLDDGQPVGTSVYVNKGCGSVFGVPSTADHEPVAIRDFILEATGDPRTPGTAWRYLDLAALPPERNDSERGTGPGFDKLKAAVLSYYTDRGLWFDAAAFSQDFDLMLTLQD